MSPRIDPEERRKEIIQAALRCLIRDGYHATSMDAIVTESGLSKGTLYWHFKNKKDLFTALFETIMSEAVSGFVPLMKQALPPEQKIELFFSSLEMIQESNRDFLTLPINLMTDMLNDEDFLRRYREIIASLANETKIVIQQGIKEGVFRPVDAEELSWTLMAIYDGILLYILFRMPIHIKKQSRILADLVINGLKEI